VSLDWSELDEQITDGLLGGFFNSIGGLYEEPEAKSLRGFLGELAPQKGLPFKLATCSDLRHSLHMHSSHCNHGY
jgi:hypothetical protein